MHCDRLSTELEFRFLGAVVMGMRGRNGRNVRMSDCHNGTGCHRIHEWTEVAGMSNTSNSKSASWINYRDKNIVILTAVVCSQP